MPHIAEWSRSSNQVKSIGQLLWGKCGLFILVCAILVTAVSCATTPTPGATVAPKPRSTRSGPAQYEGFLDTINCDSIMGWGWDKNAPDDPVSIDMYFDNARVATIVADQTRLDLQQAGKGNGVHGFAFAIPDKLKDGKPHSVQVKFAGTNTALKPGAGQTPSITCS